MAEPTHRGQAARFFFHLAAMPFKLRKNPFKTV
nr:MAG TPA: hypothetical protein [Caudoviricetes sp.]